MTAPGQESEEIEEMFEENEMVEGEGTASPVETDLVALARAEAEKYKDQWIRAAAELDNVQKRAKREVEETAKFALNKFARDLVEVVENLYRALESAPEEFAKDQPLVQNLRTGIEMTLNEMLQVLARYGIQRVYPKGEKFDHNLHQAVAQVESAEVEPGAVAQVLQAGYTLHGRLLKPAMVAVAKPPAKAGGSVDTSA